MFQSGNNRNNNSHETTNREYNDRIVLVALLMAAFSAGLYFVMSYLNIQPWQLVELVLYLLSLFAAGYICRFYFKNKKKRIEEAPIRPPMVISSRRDQRELDEAHKSGAVVLGHRRNGSVQTWSDHMSARHAMVTGQPGAGKSTLIENIFEQNITRWLNIRGRLFRMPIVLINGKGDNRQLGFVVRSMAAQGRLDDLVILDPLNPEYSERFNPLAITDGRYHDVLNNFFASFQLKPDFFQAHQAAYFNDVGRVLYYTGRVFNTRDVMVALLDERVLREQITMARNLIEQRSGVSVDERENLYASIANLLQSFQDRERVPKIQGLVNELSTFHQDDLAVVTGAYDGQFSFREAFERQKVVYVSLNTNRNPKAIAAFGRMVLQQLQLEIGRRFELSTEELAGLPPVSVILDEFAQYAYTNFAPSLHTGRAAKVSFLISIQSISQLLAVSESFQAEICSAPSTLMAMRTFDEANTRFFQNAAARVRKERRVETLEDVGFLSERYEKSGKATTTDVLEFRAEDYTLKNLPTGHMEVLMSRDDADADHFNLQVRRPIEYDSDVFEMPLSPKLRSLIARTKGANLRFKDDQLGGRHGRRSGR